LDEVEDLLLALRQILPNVHARRGLLSWSNVCSHKVPTPADGLNPDAEGYTRRRPRADGGIGRRARLRAWSGITGWRFESSSAHSEKPRSAGLFASLRPIAAVGGHFLWQRPLTSGPQRCGPDRGPPPEVSDPMSIDFEPERQRYRVRQILDPATCA